MTDSNGDILWGTRLLKYRSCVYLIPKLLFEPKYFSNILQLWRIKILLPKNQEIRRMYRIEWSDEELVQW